MSWIRWSPGLAPGGPAPTFDLTDSQGRQHKLEDYRGRWLVVFFYPKDNTPGCIREACRFGDDYDLFRELGADIVGISGDDAASHQRFGQACRLRYDLLSDPLRLTREAYQVPHVLRVYEGRSTFLIDPQGILRWAYHDSKRPEEHSVQALAFLRLNAVAKELV